MVVYFTNAYTFKITFKFYLKEYFTKNENSIIIYQPHDCQV